MTIKRNNPQSPADGRHLAREAPYESGPDPASDDFEELPFWREFALFIVENKAWWMVPIAVVLAIIGVLAALSSSGAAPFIYTLF